MFTRETTVQRERERERDMKVPVGSISSDLVVSFGGTLALTRSHAALPLRAPTADLRSWRALRPNAVHRMCGGEDTSLLGRSLTELRAHGGGGVD